MAKIEKGFYKAKSDNSQVVWATGKVGVGPHTKLPSFEGYCYYSETGQVEYSKHWLQNSFEKCEVARII